jgi:phosphomethylpyrimidine synthase
MKSFLLKTKDGFLGIGDEYPIRTNCNIGINEFSSYEYEIDKINIIFQNKETSPDLMMDLSTIPIKKPLYKYLINNFAVAVGTVPVYQIFDKKDGIQKNKFLDHLELLIETGISFFTLHFTADVDIYELAEKTRGIPITSRGGSIVLADSLINNRKDNIIANCIDDIIKIVLKHNVAISLGTTFRPAGIKDSCDIVHITETKRQLEYCKYLQSKGVKVIIENIGHIDLNNIKQHSELLNKFEAPIMPLGPLVTDNAIGYDHIASAIGASFSSYFGCTHIINSITPSEHISSNFSIEDVIMGIRTAKIVAHSINLLKFDEYKQIDYDIYEERVRLKSCLLNENNCYRCSSYCPLKFAVN